jgi:nucleotide-binding universal stress UspA family protein
VPQKRFANPLNACQQCLIARYIKKASVEFFDVFTVARPVLITTIRKMHWREVAVKQIEKILAPTDLSESSLPGVRYALDLAQRTGAEVTVLQVFGSYKELLGYEEKIRGKAAADPAFRVTDPYLPFDEFQNIAGLNEELECQVALRRFLEQHFSDLLDSIRLHEKVAVGKFDKKIVEEAQRECADLIVVSTHTKTPLADLIMGSVTQTVAREAPCPVLSIRVERAKKADGKFASRQSDKESCFPMLRVLRSVCFSLSFPAIAVSSPTSGRCEKEYPNGSVTETYSCCR